MALRCALAFLLAFSIAGAPMQRALAAQPSPSKYASPVATFDADGSPDGSGGAGGSGESDSGIGSGAGSGTVDGSGSGSSSGSGSGSGSGGSSGSGSGSEAGSESGSGDGAGGGSGSGSGSGSSGGSDSGSGSGGQDPAPDPEELFPLAVSLSAYKTDAYGQFLQRLDVVRTGGEWKVASTLGSTDIGPRLRLAAAVTWSDGSEYSQVSGEWKRLEITWTSSNSQVATVDNNGIVTATGEGEAVITAAGGGVSASVRIASMGGGPYVTKVAVIDEAGEPYGDRRITFTKIEGDSSQQLYARITYSDGSTASTLPSASDYQAHDLAGLTWSVSSTDAGYVNAATGNFKPLEDGVLSVVAEMPGGDPNANGGRVSGGVWIVVNTGKYSGGNNPSDHLTVCVAYADDESRVHEERTFSIAELRAIQTASCTYTLTKSGGAYVTDSAQGIYLTTLLDELGVRLDEVSHFRFASNDSYANSGSVTAGALFMARYYFPMYEFERNLFGAMQVYPMLAYADSWKEGGSCDPDFSSLNSGTCLRLLFGSTGQSDGWTSKSFKYLHTMTIVMKGAPPAGFGESGSGSGGAGSDGAVEGDGPSGVGEDGPGGADESTVYVSDTGSEEADAPAQNEMTASASQTQNETEESVDESLGGAGEGDSEGANGAEGARWQVYQMMSRQQSDIDAYDWANPLVPFFLPALLLVAAMGSTVTVTRYRRELA